MGGSRCDQLAPYEALADVGHIGFQPLSNSDISIMFVLIFLFINKWMIFKVETKNEQRKQPVK